MHNVINTVPYLRTSRNFPEELEQLTVEINKSYIDIANAVNQRTIALFPANRPALTGESWFVNRNQRQETFRQVYPFTTNTGSVTIAHGITFEDMAGFTRIYGTAVDATPIWYPLPYVDDASATNQISITVDSMNINVSSGAGTPPVIVSGYIVLEWLSRNAVTKLQ